MYSNVQCTHEIKGLTSYKYMYMQRMLCAVWNNAYLNSTFNQVNQMPRSYIKHLAIHHSTILQVKN